MKRKLQAIVARWSLSGGPRRRRLYYRFMSDAFSRESDAVGIGISEYHRTVGTGQEIFLLRRNVHMLEKGLTMQPRRQEFAREYIVRTVESLDAASTEGYVDLDQAEWAWIRSVLSDYFEATAASEAREIVVARERYLRLLDPNSDPTFTSGPHKPDAPHGAVNIDDLLKLATARRSVRWFSSERVPRDKVDKAMLVAAEAPTACNRQPYRFEVFDDPESVVKVATVPMGTRGYSEQIPGIIVIVGDLSAFFDERDRHLIYVDGCLAAMGLIHGLEAQGIGSCCINWPDMPDREAAMRDLLSLKPYERVVMMVAYGYADPEGLVPFSAKKDLDLVRSFRTL